MFSRLVSVIYFLFESFHIPSNFYKKQGIQNFYIQVSNTFCYFDINSSLNEAVNMECKVFCIIGERYKCIKFIKEKYLSDAECLRRALSKACASDTILQNMMQGKGIVLQKVIPEKNRLCDIEEEDKISSNSDITVLLVDLNPTFQSAVSTTSSCTTSEAGDIMEININNIPILFEEEADNLVSDKTDVRIFIQFFQRSLFDAFLICIIIIISNVY